MFAFEPTKFQIKKTGQDLNNKQLLCFKVFKIARDVDEAVSEIAKFYHNFRSYRWVGARMVIRLNRQLTPAAIEKIAADFADLLQGRPVMASGALPEEQNEPDLAGVPRLVLSPHRRNFGRVRQLIDAVNVAATLDETVG
jgi:hypothetical protein